MNRRLKQRIKNSQNLQLFLVICGAIVFYLVLSNLGVVRDGLVYIFGILAPIISAAILAFLLNPIVTLVEKKVLGKVKHRKYLRGFCVIFTVVIICVLLILLIYLVATQVAVSVRHLISNFDGYLQSFAKMVDGILGEKLNDITIFGVNLMEMETTGIQEFVTNIASWVTNHYEGLIGGALSLGSNVFNIFIAVMLTIYMLIDVDHVKNFGSRFFRSFMEPEKYVRFSSMCSKGGKVFIRFFGSNLLDSLIIGGACYLFMIIMGLPYSALIAVLVGVTNFIPTFGPLVGAIIGGFLILIMDPLGALWFIIYEIVSQFVDANVIKPKLFGDTTGLRPMWVLAAIIIGGGLFGVVGMLIGVPLFAIIAIIVNERIEKRLQRWDYVKEEFEEE